MRELKSCIREHHLLYTFSCRMLGLFQRLVKTILEQWRINLHGGLNVFPSSVVVGAVGVQLRRNSSASSLSVHRRDADMLNTPPFAGRSFDFVGVQECVENGVDSATYDQRRKQCTVYFTKAFYPINIAGKMVSVRKRDKD